MRLRFTKMHGIGNDFVVIDGISQKVRLNNDSIRFIADRKFGVGCDQILLVEPPSQDDVDFRYRIFNADGSEVENCGNGARCFARFVRDARLTGKRIIRVETQGGIMTLEANNTNDDVTVNMGPPTLTPSDIPFTASAEAVTYPIEVGNQTLSIAAISMGNPHAVTIVNDINTAPILEQGAIIETHPLFPNRVNAGFMQIISRSEINLRVYERGAGETLACGTGACAAVVAGRLQELLNESVTVNLPGGKLHIHWAGNGHPVMMTGPATQVFHGQIRI